MPTTSNFGWTTPADTDLVKDGAAAIRTLGNGIDTSFLDLKGGTTDQVLAKNSGTDLDFKWVAQDDSNAIQNAIVDAKGDLISATAADTPARIGVGANGTVLTADSAETTGLKWAAPVANNEGWAVLNGSGGTALTGATTITVSGISDKAQILVIVANASSANSASVISVRFNTDTSTNYLGAGGIVYALANPDNIEKQTAITSSTAGADSIPIGRMGTSAAADVSGAVKITGAKSTTDAKGFIAVGSGNAVAAGRGYYHQGVYVGTSAITSVSVVSSTGNFDAGTVWVFGSAY